VLFVPSNGQPVFYGGAIVASRHSERTAVILELGKAGVHSLVCLLKVIKPDTSAFRTYATVFW
jgi:hypothetical protein